MRNHEHVADCVDSDESIKFTQKLVRLNSAFYPDKEGANEEISAGYIAEFLIR